VRFLVRKETGLILLFQLAPPRGRGVLLVLEQFQGKTSIVAALNTSSPENLSR
jgi:hypothetical protein